jgi:hypothetical protein
MTTDDGKDLARMDTMGDSTDSRTAAPASADPGVFVGMTFRRSQAFGAFAAALAKAQGEISGASKDSLNPHFKNKYADLAAVWDACREPLSKNGIAVIQPPCAQSATVTVTTLLAHASGEWIESDLTMTAQQNTPQGIGSCITYARRYALSSMAGIAPEDDDGNAASQSATRGPSMQLPVNAPTGFADWLADLEATADEGTAALEKAWKASQPFLRKHLTDTQGPKWDALKARAAKVKEPVSA